MRRKENRLKVRRLFVLGAGASYRVSSASGASIERQAPLDRDFCDRISQLSPQRPAWVASCRDYIKGEWKDHQPFEAFGLEQAVLRQLGHLEFLDAIHPRRRNTLLTDFQYMNHLSHLICYVLRRAKENTHGAYHSFAEQVFPTGKRLDDLADRVVTFNYDEMLEKHLIGRFSVRQIYFDKLKDSQTDNAIHHDRFPHPLIIKLHGSVNWRCSTEAFENIVRGQHDHDNTYYVENVWHSRVGTPAPEDSSSPLIMPPLPVKPITQVSLFRFLWTRAYEYLHEAEELVICGYSLPDADRMAQSLFSNFLNKSIKQVTVVDPSPDVLSKWRGLLRRKNVNSSAQWTYFEDFDEYVRAMAN